LWIRIGRARKDARLRSGVPATAVVGSVDESQVVITSPAASKKETFSWVLMITCSSGSVDDVDDSVLLLAELLFVSVMVVVKGGLYK
jgi:hypothetical protein